jgi:hypothetical protein
MKTLISGLRLVEAVNLRKHLRQTFREDVLLQVTWGPENDQPLCGIYEVKVDCDHDSWIEEIRREARAFLLSPLEQLAEVAE